MSRIPQRIVEVRIGLPGAVALAFRDLFIDATIKRGNGGTPNKATINISNISQGTLALLEQPGLVVQVLAGLDIPTPIFTGDIGSRGMISKITGPVRVTRIEAADGRRIYKRARFSRSYPAQTTRDVILPDLLASFAIPVGPLPPLPPVSYPAGYAFGGNARAALTELLDGDAIWSIQDGAMHLALAGQPMPGNALLITPATGMRGTPERTKRGLKVSIPVANQARINQPVVVQSAEVTGEYRAVSVEHRFDNRAGPWDTNLEVIAL